LSRRRTSQFFALTFAERRAYVSATRDEIQDARTLLDAAQPQECFRP
jgi:hypothetical protein